MKSGKCPKCGSSEIITGARLIDEAEYARTRVSTTAKPDALLFKGYKSTLVDAHVCGSCGFIELYAADPGKLRN
ncbi:MAG: hypothetical protein EOP85_02860 [Verrucomicrobiaceae bacterium]|nr:MAG: hypothetical protein EOP85_02860 [Verrucomicrobiaceae bacterium]